MLLSSMYMMDTLCFANRDLYSFLSLRYYAGMMDMVHPAALAMATGGDDIMGVLSPGMTGAAALCAVHHVWMNNLKPMIDGTLKKD